MENTNLKSVSSFNSLWNNLCGYIEPPQTFIRTNPTNKYCEGKCRVAAHREKQGNQKPIFDKEQARLAEKIALIPLEDFEELILDAIRYRTFQKLNTIALLTENGDTKIYTEVQRKINKEESSFSSIFSSAVYTIEFTMPIKMLIKMSGKN